jgi:hypothetical protein
MSSVIAGALGDWTAAGGASAAAVAAIASWRAVHLTQVRLQPRLQGSALRHADGTIGAVVRNTGGSAAEGVHVMLVIGNSGFVATIGDGFLLPGEGARVESPIRSDARKAELVMFCRDRDMTLRAWSSQGNESQYRKRITRRRWYPDNNVIFNDLVPGIDLRSVREYPTVVVQLDAQAQGRVEGDVVVEGE